MSRRHKEETEIRFRPQSVAPQGDGHPETSSEVCHDDDSLGNTSWDGLKLTISKRDGNKYCFPLGLIAKAITKAMRESDCILREDTLSFSVSSLKRHAFSILHEGGHIIPPVHELGHIDFERVAESRGEKPKRGGRSFLGRLIDKVADSKVAGYCRDTLKAVKERAANLYEDMKQYCGSFLKAVHKAFAPGEMYSGKVSHFHRMLTGGIEGCIPIGGCPSRKMLNNWLIWFETWSPVACGHEDVKEARERARHEKAERLIEWIRKYLMEIAPEYAVCTC